MFKKKKKEKKKNKDKGRWCHVRGPRNAMEIITSVISFRFTTAPTLSILFIPTIFYTGCRAFQPKLGQHLWVRDILHLANQECPMVSQSNQCTAGCRKNQ
jgi:hypothetical protein